MIKRIFLALLAALFFTMASERSYADVSALAYTEEQIKDARKIAEETLTSEKQRLHAEKERLPHMGMEPGDDIDALTLQEPYGIYPANPEKLKQWTPGQPITSFLEKSQGLVFHVMAGDEARWQITTTYNGTQWEPGAWGAPEVTKRQHEIARKWGNDIMIVALPANNSVMTELYFSVPSAQPANLTTFFDFSTEKQTDIAQELQPAETAINKSIAFINSTPSLTGRTAP